MKTSSANRSRRVAPHRQLNIVYRRIVDLRQDPNNTRLHSKKQLKQIAESIRTFGFNAPVLVDQDLRIIAGHGRVSAAATIGLTELPTVMLEDLNENQIRAFQIADNKLAENAEWNKQLLAEQLSDLCAANLDFSVEATGFEIGEIDMMIDGLQPPAREADRVEVASPIKDGECVCHPGDIWELGHNRVICANPLEAGAYSLLMNGKRAAMVFTDLNRGLPFAGNARDLDRSQDKGSQIPACEINTLDYAAFLKNVCALLAANSFDGSLHFFCIDWHHIAGVIAAASQVYSTFIDMCICVKPTADVGSFYRSQHELVFVYKHGMGAHRNNIQLGKFGRSRSNVWNYSGASSSPRATEDGNSITPHQPVKPTEMIADAIVDCTARGDIVLDPSLGSGTTVIAAERVGRICYGIELDCAQVDITIRRWQKFTGGQAVHTASGQTFTQLESQIAE